MADVNIYDMVDAWNNAGTTFTAIKMDVTDTASNAASNLMDLLVGGVSRFAVRKAGSLRSGGATAAAPHDLNIGGTGRFGFFQSTGYVYTFGYSSSGTGDTGSLAPIFSVQGSSRFIMNSDLELCWASGSIVTADGDLKLVRDAADTLAQRRGTNPQTQRTYGTYTDASNYRRVALAMTTAGVATLAPEGAGTGASGNVLHISGLPTSNPGPGILWNNAGTPAIGT